MAPTRRMLTPLLLVLACGPSTGDSAASTDGATSIGGDDATDATTGDALCPAPEEVKARFVVDPGDSSIDSDCTVDAVNVDVGAGVVEHALTCDTKTLTLTIEAQPFIPSGLEVAQMVHLEYIVSPGSTTSRWFAVRWPDADNVLLLGGIMAESLNPPGEPLTSLFPNLGIEESDLLCAPEPGACGQQQRRALDISFGADTATYFDHRVVQTNGECTNYLMGLEAARDHIDDDQCSDHPESWFQLVTVMTRCD